VLSTGCQWRAITKDLPPRSTIFGYFDSILVAGHPLAHAADVQDQDGGAMVLPTLLKLYAGGGYQQPETNRVVKKALVQVNVEKRQALGSDEGLRRPAEALDRSRKALAFLCLCLAAIRLMLLRLCNPA
jgi:hypothetical protein